MANYQYIDLTGVIIPDTGDLLTLVENEYKAAFGADLIVTADTLQGTLIAVDVAARSALLANNAAVANQMNPNLAGGVFFDAVWALTGGQRDAQEYSQVSIQLAGVAGTVIPTSVTIRDPLGTELFINTQIVTLDTNGLATSIFKAVNPGPIAAPANTLTQIVNGELGLETVNNSASAVLGSQVQSDLSSRTERRNTLALQGTSLSEAITSALYKVPGVSTLKYRENKEHVPLTVDGVTLVPNSIYACIDGGLNSDIANVLNAKKTGGTNYNNGASSSPVSVNITDPFSGQIIAVLFDRPNLLPVLVKVFVRAGSTSIDIAGAVKQAISDYANGLIEGETGLGVGNSVSSFELSGAVNIQYPQIYVKDLQTTLASSPSYNNAEIPIAIFEKATISRSSIQVIFV